MTSTGTDSEKPATPLAASAKTNLAKWLEMVASGNLLDLPFIIAHNAVYHSPVEWHPYPGHELVCLLVRTAAGVFEGFKYLRVFTDGDEAVLEFSARIGDIELKGVHILRFSETGEIIDIDLMARPAKGVMALGNAIGAKAGPEIKTLRTQDKGAGVEEKRLSH